MQWRYDENRADFRPALPGEIEADPDALYIVQRGDVLMVREDGHERPMPERLDVAGVMFDREQFAAVIQNETTMREARTGNLKSFDSVGALMADLQHAPEGGVPRDEFIEGREQVRRHKLSDLVAQCDKDAPPPADMAEWDTAPPTGKEIL